MNKKIMSLVLSGSLILANGINTVSVFADNIEGTHICDFHNIENCNDIACIQSEYTDFRYLLTEETGFRMEELSNLFYQQPYEHQVVLDELYSSLCDAYNNFIINSNKFGDYLCYPEQFNDDELNEYKQDLINEHDSFEVVAKEFEDKVFKPTIYECAIEGCNEGFYTQEELDNHIEKHMDKEPTREEDIEEQYICEECDEYFFNEEELVAHMKTHKEQYICEECDKPFPNEVEYLTHIEGAHHKEEVEEEECLECLNNPCTCIEDNVYFYIDILHGAEGNNTLQFIEYEITNHNEFELIGKVNKVYINDKEVEVVNGDILVKSDERNVRSKIEVKTDIQIDAVDNIKVDIAFNSNIADEETEYIAWDKFYEENSKYFITQFYCPHCDDEWGTRPSLDEHIELIHKVECQYCNEVFYSDEKLDEHEKIHKLTCEHCEYETYEQEELDKHIKLNHTEECEYCDEVFVSYSELNKHKETHKLECEHCEYFETYEQEKLDKHIKLNHSDDTDNSSSYTPKYSSTYTSPTRKYSSNNYNGGKGTTNTISNPKTGDAGIGIAVTGAIGSALALIVKKFKK